MLDLGLCRVIGIEADKEAVKALLSAAGPNERYMTGAVGDGEAHTFHTYVAPGLNGMFRPGPGMIQLPRFGAYGRITGSVDIQTTRLADICRDDPVDFIKIDAQGAELMILEGAGPLLDGVMAVQIEVSFLPLYENQPSFGEIDTFMRRNGFIPHGFKAVKTWALTEIIQDGEPTAQLLEADIIYVRNFLTEQTVSAEKWKHLAMLAHYAFESRDLAHLALGKVSPDLATKYAAEAVDTARKAA